MWRPIVSTVIGFFTTSYKTHIDNKAMLKEFYAYVKTLINHTCNLINFSLMIYLSIYLSLVQPSKLFSMVYK